MEDYKKKYEDALERAKEELGSGCFNKGSIEYIFPELKESEDERIRKALLNEFTHLLSKGCNKFAGLENEDIITWLEKQGEIELEKPITIGKRQLTGKAAELAKEVTPESLEETKEKMLAETSKWTEEDEKMLNDAIGAVWAADYYTYDDKQEIENWLKSVKERVHPKSQWTEEDDIGFGDTLWAINKARTIAKDENDMGNLWYAENWLKELKERIGG